MTYRFLDRSLHSYADRARAFFRSNWGIPASGFQVEQPVLPSAPMSTTLYAKTGDHYIVCVEVLESVSSSLAEFILFCRSEHLPVKLFLVSPRVITAELERYARLHCLGVLDVTSDNPAIIRRALALSLAGVRLPVVERFPRKFRQAVHDAREAFLNGDPATACATVYGEIESVTRAIGEKADRDGAWTGLKTGRTSPGLIWTTEKWARILDALAKKLDRRKLGKNSLTPALLGSLQGLPPRRNLLAHRPRSLRERIERDKKLRTHFEEATDLFEDLLKATNKLALR